MIFEFNVRQLEDIPQLVPIFKEWNIQKVMLMDRPTTQSVVSTVDYLKKSLPKLDIACTYAVSSHLQPTPAQTVEQMLDALLQVKLAGCSEMLLVSGAVVHKPEFNVIQLSKRLLELNPDPLMRLSCAFDPYKPTKEQMDLEWERLDQKMALGIFDKIYMHFGLDLDRLEEALNRIKALYPETQIVGCLIYPYKGMLDEVKKRPWHGKYLPPVYYEDKDFASYITVKIIQIYKAHEVETLVSLFNLEHESMEAFRGLDILW